MPPITPTPLLVSRNTTLAASAADTALQVVCAWPVSGQYGPGSRVLYYVLVAACLLARKAEWLRNACLAAVLLIPAVAALHGITLAAQHVDGAVDMDVYGAFQLCSLGILAAPVTARLSRTYFDDPGRNMIFLWTGLILAGLLSLTVEFFRTETTGCHYNTPDNSTMSIGNFPYGGELCGLVCTVEEGPFSPLRRDAANNIYVIPAPDKLTFNTVTLFSAACCIPAILSLISMWNKILEINWARRSGGDKEKDINEPIEGTNGATIGRMNVINTWIRTFLSAVEAPIFGAAVMTILVMGERNFFSSQVRYQTEPIASIGQWAPIVGTGLAVLGSLYVALAKALRTTEETPPPDHIGDCIDRDSTTNVSFHSVINPNDDHSDTDAMNSNELMQVNTHQSTIIDSGNRRKVARMLTTIANYLGTAGHGQFDDSGFRRGKASDFPEIPGEVMRNRKLRMIREQYNPDRDADGNLTPVSSRRLSGVGSVSELQMSQPPLVRTNSNQEPVSPSSEGGNRELGRRDTLEVPPQVHLPSRKIKE